MSEVVTEFVENYVTEHDPNFSKNDNIWSVFGHAQLDGD
jgi:hypothetical protein